MISNNMTYLIELPLGRGKCTIRLNGGLSSSFNVNTVDGVICKIRLHQVEIFVNLLHEQLARHFNAFSCLPLMTMVIVGGCDRLRFKDVKSFLIHTIVSVR